MVFPSCAMGKSRQSDKAISPSPFINGTLGCSNALFGGGGTSLMALNIGDIKTNTGLQFQGCISLVWCQHFSGDSCFLHSGE